MFVCIDNHSGTSVDISVTAGHQYRWWVHAADDANASGANLSQFDVEQEMVQNSCISEKLTKHLRSGSAIQNNMRSYRDHSLQTSVDGQQIIRLYYKHSEEMKSLIAKSCALKLMGLRLLLRELRGQHPLNRYSIEGPGHPWTKHANNQIAVYISYPFTQSTCLSV